MDEIGRWGLVLCVLVMIAQVGVEARASGDAAEPVTEPRPKPTKKVVAHEIGVKMVSLEVEGSCKRGEVLAKIRRAAGGLKYCRERVYQIIRRMDSSVEYRLTIDQKGRARGTSHEEVKKGPTSMKGDSIYQCTDRLLGRIRFEPPSTGTCALKMVLAYR